MAPFGIEVALEGNIPVARGLGYSATARLGVVAALNELSGVGWNREKLLELTTALEGHPDNASPAIFGGVTVSGIVGRDVRCLRFRVNPKLKLVTLVPLFQISTEKARTLLPKALSRADATHSLNRAALITAAFAGKNYESLRGLFDDRIHQPYREPLIPQLGQVIRAGERAGAIGGFLSGSGSAIICLTLENSEAVAKAMWEQLPSSEMLTLTTDNTGFRIMLG
jgi:homoserine kinase